MKNSLNILIIALATFGLPAIGLAQVVDTAQNKKVQNPCPPGTTLVYANSGMKVEESAIGVTKTTFYKAWPWKDCETGELFDQPRKRFTQTDSSYYRYTYQNDTMVCLLIREKIVEKEVECEVQKDVIIRQDKQRKAWAKNAFAGVVTVSLTGQFQGGVGFTTYNFFARKEDQLKPWKENILKVDGYIFALTSRREADPILTTCDCLDVIKEEKVQDFTFTPGVRLRIGNENSAVQPFVAAEVPLTVAKDSKPEVTPTVKAGAMLGFTKGALGKLQENGGLQTAIAGTYNKNGFGGEVVLTYSVPVMNKETSVQANALTDAGQWIAEISVKVWEKGIVPASKKSWDGIKSATQWSGKKIKSLFTKKKKPEEEKPKTQPEIQSIWG